MQLHRVRHGHVLGENDARAQIGNVADQALERPAAFVEIDAAAQKALLPRHSASSAHLHGVCSYFAGNPAKTLSIGGLIPPYPRNRLATLPHAQAFTRSGNRQLTLSDTRPALPDRKPSADVVDDRAKHARRQAAADWSEHDRRIEAGDHPPVEEMYLMEDMGHDCCPGAITGCCLLPLCIPSAPQSFPKRSNELFRPLAECAPAGQVCKGRLDRLLGRSPNGSRTGRRFRLKSQARE